MPGSATSLTLRHPARLAPARVLPGALLEEVHAIFAATAPKVLARRSDLHAALEQAATALSIRQVQRAQSVLFRLAGFLGTLRAFRNC